jgi:Cft2 family RNA processing exonuclease
MRLLALGGASAIGASSYLLTAGGRRILIDAGVRPGSTGQEALPDLARLAREGVDGCVLTHAHPDHWGALPQVLRKHKVPILATRPTRDLAIAQARLAAAGRDDGGRELPRMGAGEVELLEGAFLAGEYLQPLRPFGPEVRITLLPAGHLPGAASILCESREGRIWISGDFTVRDSVMVPGVLLPLGRVDFAVLDATLGGNSGANRGDDETSLSDRVAKALARGGSVLLPVAPLGRAQEILVLLKRAARGGRIAAPIRVDGSAADLCDAIAEHPAFLRNEIRRELRDEPLLRGAIERVGDREKTIQGPPAVIVSTGVRLRGGPASEYALAFASSHENTILLCDEEDEEGHGPAVLKKAKARSPQLVVNGKTVATKAAVETYSFAMHADAKEALQTVSKLMPRRTILVHGSSASRTSLASDLLRFTHTETEMPQEGETVELPPSRQRTVFEPPRRGARVRPLEPVLLRILCAQLANGQRRIFSLDELILLYTEQEGVTDEAYRASFIRAIEEAAGFPRFVADERRPYLYRVITNEDTRWSPEQLRSFVQSMFQGTADYYRVGFYELERKLRLYFDFPDMAREKHRERLEALANETGWTVEVNDTPRAEKFAEVAREILPPGTAVPGPPAIRPRTREVTVRVRGPVDLEACREAFRERTGYMLHVVEWAGEAPPDAPRMEVNQAFARILERFENEPDKPYRKSRKTDDYGEYIEVGFLTPEIGLRYLDLLSELAAETGWRIDISHSANLTGLQDVVRSLLPDPSLLTREPSFFPQTRLVRIKLQRPLPPEAAEDLRKRFEEKTGLPLELEGGEAEPE